MIRPFLLLSFAASTVMTADLQVRDVRIELGRGNVSSFDGEIRYKSGANSMFASQTLENDDWTGSNPLVVSVLYTRASLSPWGFLWAAGVEYQHSDDEIAGETFDTHLIGAKVRAGIGWCPIERLRIEATAEGHLGYIASEDADVTTGGELDRATATGAYSAIGLQFGAGYVFKDHWEAGVSLRGLAYTASTSADFDNTGGSYDADYSWAFWSAAITGGYRF